MAIAKEYGVNGKPLQNTRQALILERLNSGEEISMTTLSKELGVPTRTLKRDFEKLEQMMPGEFARADDGKKYKKVKNYASVNDGEIIIEMLDSMVRDIGGKTYTKAHKLLRELKTHIDKPFYARVDVEDVSDKFDLIAQLEQAIRDKKKINMTYRRWYDEKHELQEYEEVCPLKMVVYNGFWYLLTEHKGYSKKFYLKEIRTCLISEMKFTPNKKILEAMENSINIWFSPKTKPFEVTLWLDTDAVVYFERKPISKKQKLYKKPDGTAELIVKITDSEEIFPVLKFWLPSVRIIEPESLQIEFNEMLQIYLQ
jgi:predicted DNA-binding transcriptional regulator YafY